MKKLESRNLGLLSIKAQSLPPDFWSLSPDSSFFCPMVLWLLQYVSQMLGGCSQLNIEPGSKNLAHSEGMLQSGQNCFRAGYIKLPGTSRIVFGVRTVQLGIGGILSDPGHVILNTDWNVSRWRARSTRYYYKCCVLYMMSVPGNNGVKPSFSFLIFWKVAHVCAHSSYPIILKVWYFLTTEAWRTPGVLLSECKQIWKAFCMAGWVGEGRRSVRSWDPCCKVFVLQYEGVWWMNFES